MITTLVEKVKSKFCSYPLKDAVVPFTYYLGRIGVKYPKLDERRFIVLVATWGEGGTIMWEYHKEFNANNEGFEGVRQLQDFLEKHQYPTDNITDSLLAKQVREDWELYAKRQKKVYDYILIEPFSKRSVELIYENNKM